MASRPARIGRPQAHNGAGLMSSHSVSVIIPAYNAEGFLAEAIDSVLAQGHDSLEVIVVDDGSTDLTAGVARRYDSRVRLLQQANGGIGSARNTGVDAATGDLLAFLDADDVWTENALQARLALLEAQPGLHGAFGLVENFYDDVSEGRFQVKAEVIASGQVAGTLLVRREAFLNAGMFTDVRLGEFIEWYARAIDAGLRFETAPLVTLRRRVHGASTTATARDRTAYLRAMQSIIVRRRTEGR
jgi:glycosyltransferase involved in cell wall biosynthesis